MSPRAAWRLEALRYGPVHDYAAGKADWLAAGLPTVIRGERPQRAADVMERDVATCHPDQVVADVLATPATGGAWVVVNEQRIVLGRLRVDGADPADQRAVEEAMEPGPATVRADAPAAETAERIRTRGAATLIVTTPEGTLLGMLLADAPTTSTGR
jgi:CBS-domain-containing membrane protein